MYPSFSKQISPFFWISSYDTVSPSSVMDSSGKYLNTYFMSPFSIPSFVYDMKSLFPDKEVSAYSTYFSDLDSFVTFPLDEFAKSIIALLACSEDALPAVYLPNTPTKCVCILSAIISDSLDMVSLLLLFIS